MTITRQAEIAQWARATFGEATLRRQAERMLEEVAELIASTRMLASTRPVGEGADAFAEECADVWICAARIAEAVGFDMESPRQWDAPKKWALMQRVLFVEDYAEAVWSLTTFAKDGEYDSDDRRRMRNRLQYIVDGLWVCCDFVGRDLLAAVDAKMVKNRARVWVVDGTGCGRHA